MNEQQSVARCRAAAAHTEWAAALPLRALLLGLALLAGGGGSALAQESAAPAVSAAAQETVVDINRASAQQLAEALNGVGQSRAEAIVRYRERFGPFESVEELSEVQGIGSATVERNRQRIRLR